MLNKFAVVQQGGDQHQEDRVRIFALWTRAPVAGASIPAMKREIAAKEKAEKIRQAKKDGLIGQFVYGSTFASYLVALMGTL